MFPANEEISPKKNGTKSGNPHTRKAACQALGLSVGSWPGAILASPMRPGFYGQDLKVKKRLTQNQAFSQAGR